jgi:transcription-repair coupling factor (superfamily II helicase)
MIGYFIANPQSVYYETPIFTAVLNYIQKNPAGCSFSEANDKLRIIYTDITNLKKGFERLNEIQELVVQVFKN